jgi:type IV pilus assembly protein PilF
MAALAGCVTSSDNPKPVANDSQAARINVQLGAAYMRQGNQDRAMRKLQLALKQDPKLPAAHTMVGLLYEQRGDFDKAEAQYRKALELDPKNPQAQNIYGTFLCRQQHLHKAEKYLLAAAKNPHYSTPEAAFTNAGICALKIPDQKAAETDFRKALAINGSYPDALWHMAKLSFKGRQYLETRAFLERLAPKIKLDPRVLWLGYRTETALNDSDAADQYVVKLLQHFPHSKQAQRLRHERKH